MISKETVQLKLSFLGKELATKILEYSSVVEVNKGVEVLKEGQ